MLTNSVLEHDRRFWRTLAEIERVARPGALIVIGVPGFAKLPAERLASRAARACRCSVRCCGAFRPAGLHRDLQVHEFPADYYRFSAQAARDVFLEHLDETEVHTIAGAAANRRGRRQAPRVTRTAGRARGASAATRTRSPRAPGTSCSAWRFLDERASGRTERGAGRVAHQRRERVAPLVVARADEPRPFEQLR